LAGVVVFIALLAGATQVTLETGNDTLIQEDTQEYIDNFEYQEEFGSDPIIIMYQADGVENLLTVENIAYMNELEEVLSYYDEIFTISSPVSLVKEFAGLQAAEFEFLLSNVATGLSDISLNLIGMSNAILGNTNTGNMSDELDLITTDIQVVIDDLSLDPLLVVEVAELQSLNDELEALILIETTTAAQLTFLANSLVEVANGLAETSTNLGMVINNFNILEATIPTSQATLDMMVYEEGVVRGVFDSFIVKDSNMMFLVVLEGGVSDEAIGDIIDSINETLEAQGLGDTTLVSGKPVLDRSIKSEMMGSMQVMMALSALIMVVVLLIVFRVKWSLLPLAIILFAVIATIGIMGWLGIGLTMVSMAVFPVLIGLGIDYSIQFQSRYTEELAGGTENE
jgi:predicted RND superfamily exporter protein